MILHLHIRNILNIVVSQGIRKLLLEMMYRMPTNKYLKPYVEPLLTLVFKLLEIENETNVLVCLRLVIELHKHYRPAFSSDVSNTVMHPEIGIHWYVTFYWLVQFYLVSSWSFVVDPTFPAVRQVYLQGSSRQDEHYIWA